MKPFHDFLFLTYKGYTEQQSVNGTWNFDEEDFELLNWHKFVIVSLKSS